MSHADDPRPLFADTWYDEKELSIRELREELQHIYEKLRDLQDQIDTNHP